MGGAEHPYPKRNQDPPTPKYVSNDDSGWQRLILRQLSHLVMTDQKPLAEMTDADDLVPAGIT